jgi:hypothetical protein
MNKYANQYLDKIKERILAYKPFDQSKAFANAAEGAGVGAVAGGGLGALSGLVMDPGYDAEGRKKSRIKESLKGLIGGGVIGAGVGGLGTLALPTIGQGAININKNMELDALSAKTTSTNPIINNLQNLVNKGTTEGRAAILRHALPHATVDQLIQMAKNNIKINSPGQQ